MRVEFFPTRDGWIAVNESGQILPDSDPLEFVTQSMPTPEPLRRATAALEVVFRPYVLSRKQVLLPGIHLENAANSREFSMVRHSRVSNQRAQARLLLQAAGVHQMQPPLHVQIVRMAPARSKVRDTDNLPVYGKVIRDEVAALLGYDDRDIGSGVPLTWSVFQRVAPASGVEVTLFQLVSPPGAVYKKKSTIPTIPKTRAPGQRPMARRKAK